MKTIEERAAMYTKILSADIGATMQREMEAMCKQLVAIGYIAGAKEERALLTEWHDPKEPPKEEYMTILLRFKYNERTGFYRNGQFVVDDINFNADNITGWRYIY